MGVVKPLLSGLSMLIHFLSTLFAADTKLHTARFSRLDELRTLLMTSLEGGGLLLGIRELKHVLSVRPTPRRRELGNLLIVAPTRGGKGLLAVSQLLTWPHSVVVNDIKGELFTQTAGYRQTLGPVFVIDPTGIGHRYDPLLGRETEDQLLSSATHLLHQAQEGEGRIFTQRAIVMLTQLFLAARRLGEPPLPCVRRLIRSGLLQTARELNAIDPELSVQLLDVNFTEADFTDRFLLSCWGTLSARMRLLLTETVVRSLAGADFRSGDLMTGSRPVSVYLRWSERDLLALSPLVRLLWGSLIDELITTYDRVSGKGCQPVLLLIDEAGRTAIPSLSEHATTVAGRGISLWIAIQSLSQLNAVYGAARAQILRDNMESQIFYRPADEKTADYLEHRLGRRSDYAHSQTRYAGREAGEALSEQGVPLKTAQEIQQLPDTQILGFHRNLPPFEAVRMDWREFPELVKRRSLTPPVLPQLPALTDRLPTPSLWQGRAPVPSYIDPDKLN